MRPRPHFAIQALSLLAMLFVLSACSEEKPPPDALPQELARSAPMAEPAKPLTLDEVIRRTHFAFRREGGLWTGGHTTYAVRVSEGELRVAPYMGEKAGAEIELRTEAIARGEASLAEGAATSATDAEGKLRIQRGAVVERLENTDDGVEQSWLFEERPAGKGDLTVTIRVAGQEYAGETEHGHHFADKETGLGIRYGRATWIDARGEKTNVPVSYADGALALTVPAVIVDKSAYPAVLDPTIGPELGMDEPVLVPARNDQLQPAVSYGNNQFLVVWMDYRAAGSASSEIYGVRVQSDGTVLDTTGIPISRGTGARSTPAVAFDGTNWMVVWRDTRTTSTGDIYGTRVSQAGTVLEPNGLVIASSGNKSYPAIAYDGTNYLVAFVQSSQVRGVFLSPMGVVLSSSPLPIIPEESATAPALAFNGTSYLVASVPTSGYAGYYRRVSPAGVVLDTFSRGYGTQAGSVVGAASNGDGWAIAFKRYSTSNTSYIAVHRVLANGVGDGTTDLYSIPTTSTNGALVAFGGGAYAVGWVNGTDFRAARVSSTTGALITGSTTIVGSPDAASYPAMTIGGSNLFAVFRSTKLSNAKNPGDIFGVRRDATNLGIIDSQPRLLSQGANEQNNAAVGFNGTDYLVAWEDERNGIITSIYGARLNQAGQVLDPAGIRISQSINSQKAPAIASDGSDWFVAWQDERPGIGQDDIYGTRVGANGTVKDPVGIQVSAGSSASGLQQAPAVASDGTDYLVTWNTTVVYGARVKGSTGQVLDDNGFRISPSNGTVSSVAFGDSEYLVAWNLSNNVHGTRITTSGQRLDNPAIVIGQDGVSEARPSVAFDGTNWLTVWQTTKIRGARVGTDGSVLDAAFDVSSSGTLPKTVWDGGQFWVTWQSAGSFPAIHAARLTSAKVIKTPTPLVVATDPWGAFRPVIATDGAQKVLIAYQRYDFSQPSGATRIRAKVIEDQAFGQSCTQSSECESGFCVDNVCCESACTGTCQACSAAKKGGGTDGICGPVKAGTDPNDSCQDQGTASCGTNGVCDGAGACQLYASGTSCGSGSCSGTTAIQPTCNGSGTCVAPQAGTECAPYACSAGACKQPCTTDGDCVSGNHCQAGVCKQKQAAGTACTMASQCASGFCADGVCCDSACGGGCLACTAAKKGSGVDGACGPVKVGTDPNNQCADQGVASCGTTGACDGFGSCQLYASGTPCGGICSGNSAEGKVCNGAGSCVSMSGSTDCAPFACSGGLCKTTCATVNDCAAGFQCVGGACRDVRNNGETCTTNGQCLSGFCVDGVCCNSSCTGLCQACSAVKKGAGADGACGPIGANRDPDDECAEQAASTCGTTGMCNGAGACQLHAAGTSCGAPICQGSILKTPSCNGSGTCTTPAGGQDCAPYACSAGACKSTCTTNGDCATGRVCISGACVQPLANGAACTAGTQCGSGFCADGVCCDKACTGACEACTASKKGSGSDGTCGSIAAGTDPDDECEAESEASCGRNGFCDGKGACQLYAQGTSCGASSCQGNVVQGRVCNGQGVCGTSQGLPCAPYVCSAGACKNPCANSNECQPGNFCQEGVCKPLGANGTPCASKSECQSGQCIDGVCCEEACTSKCMACSAAVKGQGSDGACEPIRTGTDPRNECAAQAPSTCGFDGFCDGQGECGVYAAGTTCKAASCNGTEQTGESVCDGVGACVPGVSTSCVEGYACVDGACATFCEDDTACDTGYVCDLSFQGCVLGDELPDGGLDGDVEMDAGDEDDAGHGGEGDVDGGDELDAGDPDGDVEAGFDDELWEVETDDGGCGCRVAGGESTRGGLGAAGLVALGAVVMMRRRGARAA